LSTALHFAAGNQTFLNLNSLQALGDYTTLAAEFQLARITRIQITVNRILSETNVTTTFVGALFPVVYIAYIPGVTSNNVTNVQNIETALTVYPYNVREVTREWDVPSAQAVGSINGTTCAFDPTKWFSTTTSTGATSLPGQLSLGPATQAAQATTTLFGITICGEFQFCCPL